MVPVLGIPSISRPDLLAECIASIDIPVRLAVIDNSEDGIMRDVVPTNAYYMKPFSNMGVAASWNAIIKGFPKEEFWLIANDDTKFGPGDLAALCASEDYGWTGINGDWRVMKITRATVNRVGLFDENFHPIYCEDTDYGRRCRLAGVDVGSIMGTSTHVGSATIEDPEYLKKNNMRYIQNKHYYREKWGAPIDNGGYFVTPFDSGRWIGEWTLNIDRLAALGW